MTFTESLSSGRWCPGIHENRFYLIDNETGHKLPLTSRQYKNFIWWMNPCKPGDIFHFVLDGITYQLMVIERNYNEIKFLCGGYILVDCATFHHPVSYSAKLYPFQVQIIR